MTKLLSRRTATRLGAATLAACLLPTTAALAQGWPAAKPITLVVGYPAGGSVDLVARTIAEPLSKRLGTPVVVENVGGAGGTIGAQKVVNAAPDGYTLLLGSGSEVSIARLFNNCRRRCRTNCNLWLGLLRELRHRISPNKKKNCAPGKCRTRNQTRRFGNACGIWR